MVLKKIIYIILTLFLGITITIGVTELVAKIIRYTSEERLQAYDEFDRKDYDIVVLTLGESTSASYYVNDAKISWSNQLELKLQQKFKNIRIKVVNKAVTGTNSTLLATNLEKNIEKYSPTMVVGMIGINDGQIFYNVNDSEYEDTTYRNLVIYKIFKWFNKANVIKNTNYSNVLLQEIKAIEPTDINAYIKFMEKVKTSDESPKNKQQLVVEVMIRMEFYNNPSLILLRSVDSLLEYFLQINTGNRDVTYWSSLVDDNLKQFDQCANKIEKLYETKNELDERILSHYVYCSSARSDKKDIKVNNRSFKLSQKTSIENTYINMKFIIDSTIRSGAKIYLMQYPLVSICRLKEIINFSKNQDRLTSHGEYSSYLQFINKGPCVYDGNSVVEFVENIENFREALNNNKYNDLFVDHFAHQFGHFSEKGHELVADQIFKHLSKEISVNR